MQPLPGLGPLGIPAASPDNVKYGAGVDYYRIIAGQYTARVHPDLPKATTFWGYADATKLVGSQQPNFRPLGGVIVAKRGQGVRITFQNTLPALSIIPIDPTIPGADAGAAQNRMVTHLHGGHVPWTSDGGPFAWFTPGATAGNPKSHGPDWQPGDFWYPNDQSARLMWYHDHAYGQTRTNAYANIASAYLLYDDIELDLITRARLPNPLGGLYTFGIPLVFQDKNFVPNNILTVDPTWKWGKPGDLWYPHVYEPNSTAGGPNANGRWDWGPYDGVPPATGTLPLPSPASCVPEAFFDHMLVNCAVSPFVEVQQKRYRFRLLNACNARFLNVQLYKALSNDLGNTASGEANLTLPAGAGPAFVQVGSEGGLLPNPVELNNPPQPLLLDPVTGNPSAYTLLMAPAERADIVIDFSGCAVGDKLILYSDTPAPFPGGDIRNDYFTGNLDQTAIGGAPATLPGMGPNTRTLLQIRVVAGGSESVSYATWLANLRAEFPAAFYNSHASAGDPPYLVPLGAPLTTLPPNMDEDDVLGKTLNEDFDKYGRLIQRLGTTAQNGPNNQGSATWGRDFVDGVTETGTDGDVQVWDIYNTTGDTHPIHFHLVNVQILYRAPFSMLGSSFVTDTTKLRGPDENEKGWKETVRMNPGEVTRVAMQFVVPTVPAWHAVKTSPRTGGNEYVWHCHILEHEEHDMMRNLVVFSRRSD